MGENSTGDVIDEFFMIDSYGSQKEKLTAQAQRESKRVRVRRKFSKFVDCVKKVIHGQPSNESLSTVPIPPAVPVAVSKNSNSNSNSKAIAEELWDWVEQTPVFVTLMGPSNLERSLLANTLLQATFKDVVNPKVVKAQLDQLEGETPNQQFLSSLNWPLEKAAFHKIINFLATQDSKIDDSRSFLLPKLSFGYATPRLRYGAIPQLTVTFPEEWELRQLLWEVNDMELKCKNFAENPTYIELKSHYETILGLRREQLTPEQVQSPNTLPLSDVVRRFTGKTFRFRGQGQDFHIDRIFIREKIRELCLGLGFYAKEMIIMMPCSFLEGNIELSLANLEPDSEIMKSRITAVVQKTNLFMILIDQHGMSLAARNLLIKSGYIKQTLTNPTEHRIIFIEVELKLNLQAQLFFALHNEQRKERIYKEIKLILLKEAKPSFLLDKEKITQVLSNISVLLVHPLLFLSLHVNPHLPHELLHGNEISKAKSGTNMPAIIGSVHNMMVSRCTAKLDTAQLLRGHHLPPGVQPKEQGLRLGNTTKASVNTERSLPEKMDELTAFFNEKLTRLSSELEVSRRSLEEESNKSVGESHPHQERNLRDHNKIILPSQVWKNTLSTLPQKMDEVATISCNLLDECTKMVESSTLEDAANQTRLKNFMNFYKTRNELTIRNRMLQLKQEINQDTSEVTALTQQDKFCSGDGPISDSLPDIPPEMEDKVKEKFSMLLSKCMLELEQLKKDLENSVKGLYLIRSRLTTENSQKTMDCDDPSTNPSQLDEMNIDSPKPQFSVQRKEPLRLSSSNFTCFDEKSGPQVFSKDAWNFQFGAQGAEKFHRFQEQLRSTALRTVDVKADGNSQFRAFAHQVYGTEDLHSLVRLFVMKEILSHSAHYEKFVHRLSIDLQEYVCNMGKEGTLGDHLSLCAMANAYCTDILIYAPIFPRPLLIKARNQVGPDRVFCLGYVNRNCYQSLISQQEQLISEQTERPSQPDVAVKSPPLPPQRTSTALQVPDIVMTTHNIIPPQATSLTPLTLNVGSITTQKTLVPEVKMKDCENPSVPLAADSNISDINSEINNVRRRIVRINRRNSGNNKSSPVFNPTGTTQPPILNPFNNIPPTNTIPSVPTFKYPAVAFQQFPIAHNPVCLNVNFSRSSLEDCENPVNNQLNKMRKTEAAKIRGKNFCMPSLVNLCVNKIVEYADVMPNLHGCIPEELLQQILKLLITQNRLEISILDRLLDSSIWSLDLSHSKQVQDDSCAIIAERCSHLTKLTLTGCTNITSAGISQIAKGCSLLMELDLESCCGIDDSALQTVAQRCPNLQTINVAGCPKVTNASLEYLYRHCSNLTVLNLKKCNQISDSGFELIGNKLQQLDISECTKLTDTAVLQVATNSRNELRALKLSGTHVTDASLQQIAILCGNLRVLELSGCEGITDGAINSLWRLPWLCRLNLSLCKNLTCAAFNFEKPNHLSQLCYLDISRCLNIGDNAVSNIASACPNLRDVNLSFCEGISNEGLLKLAACCRNITTLLLTQCKRVSDVSIAEIAKRCTRLNRISLQSCDISDQALMELVRNCRNLTSLDLSCCEKLTDSAIKQIPIAFRELKELSLEETNVCDEGVASLAGCVQLTTLKLAYCAKLSDYSLQQLARSCPLIRVLDLSHCNNITMHCVLEALKCWQELNELSLRGFNALTSHAIEHPSLQTLNLSWAKNLEDDAIISLGKGCPRLCSLDIARCPKITSNGLHKLVQFNTNLKTLNLRGCTQVSSLTVNMLSACGRLVVYR